MDWINVLIISLGTILIVCTIALCILANICILNYEASQIINEVDKQRVKEIYITKKCINIKFKD